MSWGGGILVGQGVGDGGQLGLQVYVYDSFACTSLSLPAHPCVVSVSLSPLMAFLRLYLCESLPVVCADADCGPL